MSIDTVVIAFYGDDWISPCIDFMHRDVRSGHRLIISDNFGNSNVGRYGLHKSIEVCKLRGPVGFAEANNLTLVSVGFRSDYVCFLNQDTKSSPGWLSAAELFLESNADIGAITPLLTNYEGNDWDPDFFACAQGFPIFNSDEASRIASFTEVPKISAAAMIVRTAVLVEVGGFDPIFGSYYEDFDLCRRIRASGYKVGIWSGATVAHYSGSATRTASQERTRQRLIVRNKLIHRLRGSTGSRAGQLVWEILVELPRQIGRSLFGRPASKDVSTLIGGYFDALSLGRRLVSRRYDEEQTRRYFTEIGWPKINKGVVGSRKSVFHCD